MAPRKTKRKKLDVSQQWLARYHDPRAPGSLGGVQRFARAHQIPLKKAQRVLQRPIRCINLAYLSNTPTNLCTALLNFLLFCFILYCYAFVQYCYVK